MNSGKSKEVERRKNQIKEAIVRKIKRDRQKGSELETMNKALAQKEFHLSNLHQKKRQLVERFKELKIAEEERVTIQEINRIEINDETEMELEIQQLREEDERRQLEFQEKMEEEERKKELEIQQQKEEEQRRVEVEEKEEEQRRLEVEEKEEEQSKRKLEIEIREEEQRKKQKLQIEEKENKERMRQLAHQQQIHAKYELERKRQLLLLKFQKEDEEMQRRLAAQQSNGVLKSQQFNNNSYKNSPTLQSQPQHPSENHLQRSLPLMLQPVGYPTSFHYATSGPQVGYPHLSSSNGSGTSQILHSGRESSLQNPHGSLAQAHSHPIPQYRHAPNPEVSVGCIRHTNQYSIPARPIQQYGQPNLHLHYPSGHYAGQPYFYAGSVPTPAVHTTPPSRVETFRQVTERKYVPPPAYTTQPSSVETFREITERTMTYHYPGPSHFVPVVNHQSVQVQHQPNLFQVQGQDSYCDSRPYAFVHPIDEQGSNFGVTNQVSSSTGPPTQGHTPSAVYNPDMYIDISDDDESASPPPA